ncbi:MAG: hypothetical protein ABIM64_04725 [candidate division WOR-3 bacterium]
MLHLMKKIDEKIRYAIENFNRLSISQIARNTSTSRYVITAILRTYEMMMIEGKITPPPPAPARPPAPTPNVKGLKREEVKGGGGWWWVAFGGIGGLVLFLLFLIFG